MVALGATKQFSPKTGDLPLTGRITDIKEKLRGVIKSS
jgi:hypothetical protein